MDRTPARLAWGHESWRERRASGHRSDSSAVASKSKATSLLKVVAVILETEELEQGVRVASVDRPEAVGDRPGRLQAVPVTSSTTRSSGPTWPAAAARRSAPSVAAVGRLAEHAHRLREQRHALADLVLGDGVDRTPRSRVRSRRRGRRRPGCRSRASGRPSQAGPGARQLPPRRRSRRVSSRQPHPDEPWRRGRPARPRSSNSVERLVQLVESGPEAIGETTTSACASRAARRSRRRASSSPRRSNCAGRRSRTPTAPPTRARS